MTEREKQGMDRNEYISIHKWLRKNYGKANKCECEQCIGKSPNFTWALIKGKRYERNRDNYIQLCLSCHVKYDWDESKRGYMRLLTKETRDKIANKLRGRKANFSPEDIRRRSDSMKGENNYFFGVSMTGTNHPFFGRNHSIPTRQMLSKTKRLISDELIDEIRYLYWLGCKQSVIANEYKLNRPHVFKIVHNKICAL